MKFFRLVPLAYTLALAACAVDPIDEVPAITLAETLDELRIARHMGIKPATATTDGNLTVYEFDPKSPARCLDGSPFFVSVRKGKSKNAVLYLQGGGACWDHDTCWANPIARTLSEPLSPDRESTGMFRRDNAENPLADWNLVYASYCDGSVWSGDADISYDGRVTFHHGLANLSAAVTLLKKQFGDAPKIMVTGSSAGGYGTLMGFMVVRSQFPAAPLYVLNDAGPWLMNPENHAMTDNSLKNWGAEQFYPPGCEVCREQMYYIADWAMNRDANSRWGLFSYEQDFTVGTLYLRYGSRFTDVLFDMSDGLRARHPKQFAGYFLRGGVHTILAYEAFDTAEKNGVKLTQWIDDMVNDSPAWTDLRH